MPEIDEILGFKGLKTNLEMFELKTLPKSSVEIPSLPGFTYL